MRGERCSWLANWVVRTRLLALPIQRDMTPNQFRSLALRFPGAVESSHMNHPDFRIEGKVFATLGYPDKSWAMVKLTPEQQQSCVRESPLVFRPCNGVWGQRGATNIHLVSADRAWCKLGSKWHTTMSGLQ